MAVYLQITSQNIHTEKRFDKSLTLLSFKEKLEPITGIPALQQSLSLYRGETLISPLVPWGGKSDDEILLGAFPVDDNLRIHITDLSGLSSRQAQYQDTSLVEKFELSEKEYDKRHDSVRAFKQRNKMGRFAPEAQEAAIAKSNPLGQDSTAPPPSINIGDRCQVKPTKSTGELLRRGSIRYVGLVGFQSGYWIGVEYDEPLGKNDGSVQGESYFTCNPNYGAFLRPDRIEVGDFPPESFDSEDLDEL